MKKGFAKFIGKFSGTTLFRVVCVLFALVALSAWAVSGVYAKYVSSDSADSTAGVACMGVKLFNISEHEAKDISDDLSEVAKEGTLYKLTKNLVTPKEGNKYNTVIPGIDIPKDPFIELKLSNNEVSYELYIWVKEIGFPEDAEDEAEGAAKIDEAVDTENTEPKKKNRKIDYELDSDDWEFVKKDDVKGKLYRFKRNKDDVVNGVFIAGTEYDFTVGGSSTTTQSTSKNVIQILKDNKIKVSEHFDSDHGKIEFSLTFTAYLQQVIDISETGSGAEGD